MTAINIDFVAVLREGDMTVNASRLRSAKIGDMVRVRIAVPGSQSSELFWICLTKKQHGRFFGRVEADLLFTADHGIAYGHAVSVKERYITYVMPADSPTSAYIELAQSEGIIER